MSGATQTAGTPRMALELRDLALDADVDATGETGACRVAKRDAVVRMVEFSPWPRRDAGERLAVGFTANESRSGLCMLTREPQPVGRTLRLSVREVDGRTRLDAIARVVWCNPAAGDRAALGVELLEVRDEIDGARSRS